MKELNTWESNNSIEYPLPVPNDFSQGAEDICKKALNGAKRPLHPLLGNVELNRLDQRDEFLQAFKSALEAGFARKLAVWQPTVQAVFQFDERQIIDIQTWDGSIHLLVKVPLLSHTVEEAARELDQGLVRYVTQMNWQRFQKRRSILDVQQVTINELRHAVGYGAIFCAVYTAPIQVWPRDRQVR